SQEDATLPQTLVPGLAVLPGKVLLFQGDAYGAGKLKVPHMGWNQLQWSGSPPLFAGLSAGAAVYFVHSYYVQSDDASITAATTDYGVNFCAAVHRGNVWATQFHPENSQRVGLQMLRNFAAL